MNKIKTGDTVKVIAGKDKGKDGKVLAVKDGKVLVEGIGMVTKHTKPSAANQQGGSLHRRIQRYASLQGQGNQSRLQDGWRQEGPRSKGYGRSN